MKIYLAPLEGITNYVYRRALFTCFDGFDKYFIPFIRAKQNLNLSGREKKDLLPENNEGMYAVPQILTKKQRILSVQWNSSVNTAIRKSI